MTISPDLTEDRDDLNRTKEGKDVMNKCHLNYDVYMVRSAFESTTGLSGDISFSLETSSLGTSWISGISIHFLCILLSVCLLITPTEQLFMTYYIGMLLLDLTAVLYLNVYNSYEMYEEWRDDDPTASFSSIGFLSPVGILSWLFFIFSIVMYSKAFQSIKPAIMAVSLIPVFLHAVHSKEVYSDPPFIATFSFGIAVFIAIETLYSFIASFFTNAVLLVRLLSARLRVYGFLVMVIVQWRRLGLQSVFSFYWAIIWNLYMLGQLLFIQQHYTAPLILACISYSCNSFIKILSLCFVLHYISKVLLDVVRLYIQDETLFVDEGQHRPTGLREGIGFLSLSLYTSLTYVDASKRMVLLELIFLLLISALVRSAFEIVEPYLLALHSLINIRRKQHIRIISFCIFLLFIATVLGIYLYRLREKIPFSISNIITIGQIISALVLYGLYMYDSCHAELWEELDDYVYYVKGACRTFEFVLILVVLGYRVLDTSLEWTLFQSLMVLVHLYVNIYVPVKNGWQSIRLRRLVNKKLNALPLASENDLQRLNDVCAICLEELRNARITPCNHIFHNLCLRKWLNVRNKCPLCHSTILFQ